jgi:hypothetical protein
MYTCPCGMVGTLHSSQAGGAAAGRGPSPGGGRAAASDQSVCNVEGPC